MEITINIPDEVLNRMKELKITDKNVQKEILIDFVNDCLDTNYSNGMTEKFKKWTLNKENIEVYLVD
jgi:5,10-methylenetetrahydrofolate reductase